MWSGAGRKEELRTPFGLTSGCDDLLPGCGEEVKRLAHGQLVD
jgi:hypothetical protein